MRPKKFLSRASRILSVCFVLMWMTVSGIDPSTGANLTEAQNRWLLLLYDDGDFDNGFDALWTFAGEAYAHENLEVLVLQDNYMSPAMIWQIGPNHERIPQKYLGEINMADPASLEYFLRFANNQFPNRRTILCFYDHGAGWWGACIDDTSYNKDPKSPFILSPGGIRGVLEKTRPVDLICFTAPCLMGSIEAAYELRRCTEAIVGSENLSGYILWMGTIRFICDILKSRPDIGNHELAQAIVRSAESCYQSYDPDGYDKYFTLSAISSDRLDDAVLAIRELSTAVLANRAEAFSSFDQALEDIRINSTSYADVIDLFEEAMKRCQNQPLREFFKGAIDAVRQAVLAEAHGAQLPGSNGLNIYFPPPPNIPYNPYYGSYGIAFAQDSGWFELLNTYLASWPNALAPETRIPILQTDGLNIPPYGGEKSIPIRWIDLAKRGGGRR